MYLVVVVVVVVVVNIFGLKYLCLHEPADLKVQTLRNASKGVGGSKV